MQVVIKKAALEDVDSITKLYRKFRSGWTPVCELKEIVNKYPALKVLSQGEMVGFAYFYGFAPDIVELANIYIQEEYRSQNIGSDLLAHLESLAVENGYKGIILNNSDAYEGKAEIKSPATFYLRNGYELVVKTDKTRVFYKDLKSC